MAILKKYSDKFIFGAILAGVVLFSLSTLTTKPRIWIDEVKSIELARNFLNFGKLDIQTAPGKFTNAPEILQTTGYPATVPLALFFKLFGFGLAQARIYMILWMAAALSALFYFGRRLMGEKNTLWALLLISTFASFYDSGRTVVGEIPGLVFLTAGLYFWLLKDNYFWSGLFWGLAVVTKPSVFGLLIPTVFFTFLLFKRKGFFKNIFLNASGMVPAAVGWMVLVLGNPFSAAAWRNIAKFYQNPYSSASITENIMHNLTGVFSSPTIIYFSFLFLLAAAAFYWLTENREKSFFGFIIIYSLFAFIYYLRSPGWLRYILIAEILILFALPRALQIIWPRIKNRPNLLISLLVLVQIFHLVTGAKIFYSDTAIRVSSFLNQNFPGKSVAVLDAPEVAVLLNTRNRFTVFEMAGSPVLGENPFLFRPLPDLVVFQGTNLVWPQGNKVLAEHYRLNSVFNGFKIFALNQN